MEKESYFQWLHDFRKRLIQQNTKKLVLPLYDKIDVKSLQIFRQQSRKKSTSKELPVKTNLANEFGFVFAQNQLMKVNIPEKYQKKGLIICDLATAWLEHQDLFLNYFAKLISPQEDQLVFEHYQRLNGGVLIFIPDNLSIDETLQAYFEYPIDSQSLQIILIVGKNTKLSITENQLSSQKVDGDYTFFGEIYLT